MCTERPAKACRSLRFNAGVKQAPQTFSLISLIFPLRRDFLRFNVLNTVEDMFKTSLREFALCDPDTCAMGRLLLLV